MTILEKIMCGVVMFIVFGVMAAVIIGLIISEEVPVKTDYVSQIVVDKSEKVEWALSNAVENVRSRNFVVTSVKTTYVRTTGNFVIECGGTELAHVLELGN